VFGGGLRGRPCAHFVCVGGGTREASDRHLCLMVAPQLSLQLGVCTQCASNYTGGDLTLQLLYRKLCWAGSGLRRHPGSGCMLLWTTS
jgi:hypothetical protein